MARDHGRVFVGCDGYLERTGPKQRFVFTWKGSDEMDAARGSGWIQLKDEDELLGSMKLHLGDRSKFRAHRAGLVFTAGQGQ